MKIREEIAELERQPRGGCRRVGGGHDPRNSGGHRGAEDARRLG